MGKTVITAMACHKGGVGKTTSTISLGNILAAAGKRVLLIDMDPQANLTKTYLERPDRGTVYEAFQRARSEKVYDLPIYGIGDNIDLVPSCLNVAALEAELASVMNREKLLKKLLLPVQDGYDYILMDCAAQVGFVLTNAFTAATRVLIPINCDGYSAEGFMNMNDIIEEIREDLNPELQIAGLFVTRFLKNRKADRMVLEALRGFRPELICDTIIRECADFAKATLVHKDIYGYNPLSRGSEDYLALCREVFGVEIKG